MLYILGKSKANAVVIIAVLNLATIIREQY